VTERVRVALTALALFSASCLPFFGGKGPPPRSSLAIQQFTTAANELGLPPSPPPLADVTRLLGAAVESLSRAPGAHERGQEIVAHANAMNGTPDQNAEHARRSVELALGVLEQMKKPSGSKKARDEALRAVREAVGVFDSYRALGRALALFSGGQPGVVAGTTVHALVARISVENDETARRTVAETLFAIAEALRALQVDPGDLAERAGKLPGKAPLEYCPALRDALDRAVAALGTHKSGTPAFATLVTEARHAVERVTRDRPFELQRPAIQDALRLISDALTIAAPTTDGGR
jgi:hypothetical protein